jgi:serine/threonine protein kinase
MANISNAEQHNIHYPASLSPEAVSFIQSLLRKDPNQRMTIDRALHHPFLQKKK